MAHGRPTATPCRVSFVRHGPCLWWVCVVEAGTEWNGGQRKCQPRGSVAGDNADKRGQSHSCTTKFLLRKFMFLFSFPLDRLLGKSFVSSLGVSRNFKHNVSGQVSHFRWVPHPRLRECPPSPTLPLSLSLGRAGVLFGRNFAHWLLCSLVFHGFPSQQPALLGSIQTTRRGEKQWPPLPWYPTPSPQT